jgi:hypothetical protein
MTRGPSVKTLSSFMYKDQAFTLKCRMKMCQTHAESIMALKLADEYMDGHGVESLYPEYPLFFYVNKGDTYSATLCYDGDKFFIGSWGDWVEGKDLLRKAY